MKPYSNQHTTANKAANVPNRHSHNATRRQFIRYFKKAKRQADKQELQKVAAEIRSKQFLLEEKALNFVYYFIEYFKRKDEARKNIENFKVGGIIHRPPPASGEQVLPSRISQNQKLEILKRLNNEEPIYPQGKKSLSDARKT